MEESIKDAQLDRVDMAILRHLQRDGRMSNAELAEKVNASPATCHRRTQRLFADGYISNVRAQIDPQRADRGTLIMIGIVLDRSTPESFAAFEEAVVDLPFVLDCILVTGDFDFMLKIRARDMADFKRLWSKHLIVLPGVRQTRTFVAMKEVIDSAPLDF